MNSRHPLTFDQRLLAHFEDPDASRRAIDEYFTFPEHGKTGYTGSQFEQLIDLEHPNEISARDMVAITTLDTLGGRVRVPPRVVPWMLGDGREQITEQLENIPHDKDLWEVTPDVVGPHSPACQLWTLLHEGYWPRSPKSRNGIRTTIASKLLAAKRPRLLPIMDKKVTRALGRTDSFWLALRSCLAVESNRDNIDDATNNRPQGVSLLRAVDVVVWMNEQQAANEARDNR